VGVRHGRIVYVGTDSLPAGLIGRGTEVVDSGVYLGLCDLNDAEIVDAARGLIPHVTP
jgi:hypothetical protein